MKKLAIAVSILMGPLAWGQTTQEPPKISQEAGQPVTIQFADGREAKLYLQQYLTALRSTLTLSENSCTPKLNNKVEFMIPLVRRGLVGVWTKHPTRQGKPVVKFDQTDKKDEILAAAANLSLLNGEAFLKALQSITVNQVEDQAAYILVKENNPNLIFLNCKGDCDRSLLPNREIIFWDENFESQNMQARMNEDDDAASLNQMSSRLQQLPVTITKQTIAIGLPKKSYGVFAQVFPPGITYQILWTFKATNLVDPDDQFCQMKWDMDFTPIFTQFTAAEARITDVEKFDSRSLSEYILDQTDLTSLSLSSMFNSNWSGEELK